MSRSPILEELIGPERGGQIGRGGPAGASFNGSGSATRPRGKPPLPAGAPYVRRRDVTHGIRRCRSISSYQ